MSSCQRGVLNVCVRASFSPGLLKSISRRKAKGGFFLLGAATNDFFLKKFLMALLGQGKIIFVSFHILLKVFYFTFYIFRFNLIQSISILFFFSFKV